MFFYFCKYNSQNQDFLEFLENIGENPNISNKDHIYPIHLLCEKSKEILLLKFLDLKSIDYNVKNKQKETALIILSKSRSLKAAEKLLGNGCEVNQVDSQKRNALHWAINNNEEKDTNFDFEELLLNYGVDYNAVDYRGRNPIHYFFVKIGRPFISKSIDPIESFSDFVIIENLNLDKPDEFGNTSFLYACQRGSYLCASLLIKKNVKMNLLNKEGNNGLGISLIFKKNNLAMMLLQFEIEIPKLLFIYDYLKMKNFEDLLKKLEIEKKKEEKIKRIGDKGGDEKDNDDKNNNRRRRNVTSHGTNNIWGR